MEGYVKKLFLIYGLLVIIKFILSFFIPTLSIFSDEYMYAKMAQSFFHSGQFLIHGIPTNFYPPLYPMVLSVSYIFGNMQIVYGAMQLINAVLSSLVIFPVWLMANEFFDRKKSLIIALVCALIPFSFSFTYYIMAENLFLPLFLFSFYFIYKSFLDKKVMWDILGGAFLGLLYLTKMNGIILIAVVAMFFVVSLIMKDFLQLWKKVVMALSFFIVCAPWSIRNIMTFGFSIPQLLGIGGYSSEAVSVVTQGFSFTAFFVWFLLYVGFLILSSGVVFPVLFARFLNKTNLRDRKKFIFIMLLLFSLFITLVIAANHNSKSPTFLLSWIPGRPLGRYVDFMIPLIIIGGALCFSDKKINFEGKRLFYLFAPLMLFSTFLTIFPLLPLNNLSLSWVGAINLAFNFIFFKRTSFGDAYFSLGAIIFFALFFLTLLILAFRFLKKMDFKKLFSFIFLFFVLVNVLNFALISYNSNHFWEKGEQNQMGKWFNGYDKKFSKVLFDEDDCTRQITKTYQEGICDNSHISTLMGFWMNDEITIGDIKDAKDYDYVVSKKKLDYEILKETSNGIHLYKVI